MNGRHDDESRVGNGSGSDLSRREALTRVVAAAGFVTLGLKDALAQSRRTGKPLFGTRECDSLNRLVPAAPGPEYRRLLEEAVADPKAFLTARFTFTARQQSALAAVTPDEIRAIQSALRTALQDDLIVRFDCGALRAPGARVLHNSSRLQIGAVGNQRGAGFRGTLHFASPPIL